MYCGDKQAEKGQKILVFDSNLYMTPEGTCSFLY